MKVQVPEPVDILGLVTAHFPDLITVLGGLSSRTVDRPTASPLEQSVTFHPTQQRNIARHRSNLWLRFGHNHQVVKMQLVTPTGVLPVLLGQ